MLGDIICQIAKKRMRIGSAQRMRNGANEHRIGAKSFNDQPQFRQFRHRILKPVAICFIHLDDLGHQQCLAPLDRIFRSGGTESFEHKAFVRGVLVYNDQSVFSLGDNIGVGDLATRDPERIVCDGFFGDFRLALWLGDDLACVRTIRDRTV